ncbi:OmpA family protein [Vibrio sp. OCN044]|uniref:OmpA family protein n=1 Tax=Vibrio tetraodonis subsp. pristinus TaxID=2695891 RepID=A0A6L8LXR5_9VIBR|nr:OmpA family protein [Vibrio tetraodonis]MYM57972.1 OmpA family protein [Vibrio tetraodonis subsp. pristinus]
MNIKVKKKYLFLIIFYFSSALANFEQEIPMDEVKWTYRGSSLKCSLFFNNLSYGKFSFRSEEIGKTNLNIYLEGNNNHFEYGELYSAPEPWSENNSFRGIGHHVPITDGELIFNQDISLLIDKIKQGNWIKLSFSGKQVSEPQSLLLPTTHIQKPLAQFQRCLSRLPHMSYVTARDLTFSFPAGEHHLDNTQRRTLYALTTYLDADDSVSRILIDGYSDNIGSDLNNLSLSERRANAIADVLLGYGISKTKIQIRSHGSRYPVSNNDTAEGQAKNRRVTVRLVRSDEKIVPHNTQTINDMEEA